ncbi:alpha/beta fold hydrolase [Pseudomonas cichorii]|uniref:Alpha/beta fold hydrolase n=1 Tax=Pseudomonas lijiangensis TaxID=2995658 RepID=A0ABX8I104_9PSED|nr:MULTISPECIES: alpha/beta fold hydrolase [Pseudomonas syringae group]MBX8501890.1 alpha/beta fold hydrolase [Pseudomonas lijiangensis]MBX8506725.1 alpha/beta fold hydrolase [Pseudomonas lijiangensis]MBX8541828.1 alpha/beta fold hydrolase [Pseudomonas cichorii]MBX8566397.1 alpha/beta fold hydrolase [Pseudomonas cichorii]MBX8581626.1 alpha/beta fold hydrolase [Pseudomonas cichorii]
MVRLCAAMLVILLNGLISVQAQADEEWSAGFHELSFPDPLDSQLMQAFAFYPSTGSEQVSVLQGYRVEAGEDAPIAMGRFPLLLLSHGNTGNPLALHDLATSLARQGFVVVAVMHPGDNYRDHSRLGSLSNLYGRPLQISEAISAALLDPMLSPYLNSRQVGVIGYSAGGETALILAGAQPDLKRLRQYCVERPDDRDACKTQGELVADRDDLHAQADPRVGALMLMAPLSLMFGRHTLSDVHVPVLMYAGDDDQLLPIDKNAEALARKLPQVSDYKLLAGAGHFVFMAPCSDEQRATMPLLCTDREGVDREDIHRTLSAEAVRFFSSTLGSSDEDRSGMQTAHHQWPDSLLPSASDLR